MSSLSVTKYPTKVGQKPFPVPRDLRRAVSPAKAGDTRRGEKTPPFFSHRLFLKLVNCREVNFGVMTVFQTICKFSRASTAQSAQLTGDVFCNNFIKTALCTLYTCYDEILDLTSVGGGVFSLDIRSPKEKAKKDAGLLSRNGWFEFETNGLGWPVSRVKHACQGALYRSEKL